MKVNTFTKRSVQYLHDYQTDTTSDWSMFIGHYVEREPTFTTYGDACEFAGGGYCHQLEFWYDLLYGPELIRRISLSTRHIHKIHINCLECIMVIIQIAAVITRLDQLPPHLSSKYKDALSSLPVLLSCTDNTNAECWTAKVSAKIPKSQALVEILAELLKTRGPTLGIPAKHIAVEDNIKADFITRPDLSLSPQQRLHQIYTTEKRMKSYSYFRLHPDFVLLLQSRLYCEHVPGPPRLPKTLGQFKIIEFTTFNSSIL
jgi:hypothetical protein